MNVDSRTNAHLVSSPRRNEGRAWHRRVNGIHVLSLHGSFHEMGRQHGALLADEIRRGPIPYYRRFVEKIVGGSSYGPAGPIGLAVLQRTIGSRVARAMPDFALETIRGVAHGAGLSFDEVLEGCTMPDTLLWLASRMMQFERLPPAVRHRLALGLGCTSAIAWGSATRDGMLLHARNLDYHGVSCWPSNAAVMFHSPDQGQRYVSCSAAGVALGGFTAMNEAGLTLTVHQHMFTSETRLGGTPIGIVGDIVMREARTLDEAESILARHRPIGCWTYLVADGRRREVLCWEENPKRHVARRISTDAETFGYANIYLDRELGETELDLYPTYWRHNLGRQQRVNTLLREEHGRLDAPGMAAVLGDLGDPRCRLRNSIAMVLTVGSVVFRPEDGTVWLGSGEAPTSHGTFVPFSLRTMDYAPDAGTFAPGDAVDPRARDAFEHYRRAYIAYVDRDDVASARNEMALACHRASEQSAYHAVAGLMALQDGDALDAIRRLEVAVSLGHPDEERRAAFALWRGRAFDVAGRRADALQAYRAALATKSDPRVFEAARKGIRRPYRAREARRIHVEMSLGDVMAP
jgi:hypothetical protein